MPPHSYKAAEIQSGPAMPPLSYRSKHLGFSYPCRRITASDRIQLLDSVTAPEKTRLRVLRASLFVTVTRSAAQTSKTKRDLSRTRLVDRIMNQFSLPRTTRPRSASDGSPGSVRAGKRRATTQDMPNTQEQDHQDGSIPESAFDQFLASFPISPATNANTFTTQPTSDNTPSYNAPYNTTAPTHHGFNYVAPAQFGPFNMSSAGYQVPPPSTPTPPVFNSVGLPSTTFNYPLALPATPRPTLNSPSALTCAQQLLAQLLPLLAEQEIYQQLVSQNPGLLDWAPIGHYSPSPATPTNRRAAGGSSSLAHRSHSDLEELDHPPNLPGTGARIESISSEASSVRNVGFTHTTSESQTTDEAMQPKPSIVEAHQDAPYYAPIPRLHSMFYQQDRHGRFWELCEKHQLVIYWAGLLASDDHFAAGLRSTTMSPSGPASLWTNLSEFVFLGSRHESTLYQAWMGLIKQYRLIIVFAIDNTDLGENLPTDRLISIVRTKLESLPANAKIADKLTVADARVWCWGDNSWLSMVHPKYVRWNSRDSISGVPSVSEDLDPAPVPSHASGSQHNRATWHTPTAPHTTSTSAHSSQVHRPELVPAHSAPWVGAQNAVQPTILEALRDHHEVANQEISLDQSKEKYLNGFSVAVRLECMERLKNMQATHEQVVCNGLIAILNAPRSSTENIKMANDRLSELYLQKSLKVDFGEILDELLLFMRERGMVRDGHY